MSALIIGVDLAATQFELALTNDGFELQERLRAPAPTWLPASKD